MTPAPEAVEGLVRTLFPPEVAVAAERIVPANPKALWPEERPAVLGAVPARLDEFVAGRTAARRVLQALDLPPQALPMGPDRVPVWPGNVSGSITHAAGLAVAVGRHRGPVGVDLEPDEGIPPDLWDIICTPAELQRLGPDRTGHGVRRVFCAKEAVFKAQGPYQRAMFGHETLDVTLAETGFSAQFLTHAGAIQAGQIVQGRIVVAMGLVLAGVAV